MTDRENEGDSMFDPLELAIRGLKASTPPGDPLAVRARVLAAFDARSHRSVAWPRIGLAAAALLLVCVALWRVAARQETAYSRLLALSEELDSIDARLTAFADRRSESSPSEPLAVPEALPVTADSEIEAVLALTGSDPGYLRLLTARRYEAASRDAAIERYRDLIEDYAESPAASVARARLAELAR